MRKLLKTVATMMLASACSYVAKQILVTVINKNYDTLMEKLDNLKIKVEVK